MINASTFSPKKNDNTAAKPQPLRLNAWLVDAYPGKGANDPVLKTIQPALNAFAAEMGTSHFAAGHYLTSVSDAGQLAQVSPTPGESLEYRVTPTEGGVVLDFNESNQVVGIEMLNLSRRTPELDLREFQFLTA